VFCKIEIGFGFFRDVSRICAKMRKRWIVFYYS